MKLFVWIKDGSGHHVNYQKGALVEVDTEDGSCRDCGRAPGQKHAQCDRLGVVPDLPETPAARRQYAIERAIEDTCGDGWHVGDRVAEVIVLAASTPKFNLQSFKAAARKRSDDERRAAERRADEAEYERLARRLGRAG